MATTSPPEDDAAVRARAWRDRGHACVCDVLERWAHGTVARATELPAYHDFNVVRVEEKPRMDADGLVAFADAALAGLRHRRLEVDLADVGDRLRLDLTARGWRATALLWMLHAGPRPAACGGDVEEVPYDEADDLRAAWQRETMPDSDPGDYLAQARAVALLRGARILGVRESGLLVGYAELVGAAGSAEITEVYVRADRRGQGIGTALTRGAIAAAGDVPELWIVADAEARAKDLYARLGFRPAWTTMQLTLLL